MKSELDRVASRMPMDTLSMKRYELPPPPAGKMTDVAAWNECVDNSLAQLEHQRTRIGKNLIFIYFFFLREIVSFSILQRVKVHFKIISRNRLTVVREINFCFFCEMFG